MKGTDCTPEQLKAAEQFILDRSHRAQAPGTIILPFDQLVRLVAWYGALRYQAGKDGINSLETAGVMDAVKRS